MPGLPDRLRDAIMASRKTYSAPHEEAGRRAENHVADLLRSRQLDGWRVYTNLRIPDPLAGRRREIDFVILSRRSAFFVELKNWTGFVYLKGDTVFQERLHGKGTLDHGPLLADLRHKAALLDQYHRQRGAQKTLQLSPRLVFYSARAQLAESLAAREDVIFLDDLLAVMPTRPPHARSKGSLLNWLLEALLRLLGQREETNDQRRGPEIAPEDLTALDETLASLPTWDELEFYGGGRVSCDIRPTRGPSMPSLDRTTVARIDLEFERNPFAALFRTVPSEATLEGWRGERRKVRVKPDWRLTYRAAGDSEDSAVELRRLVRIDFGYSHRSRLRTPLSELNLGSTRAGTVKGAAEGVGVFVDIGAERDGLVYWRKIGTGDRDQLLAKYPVGSAVTVQIVKVDLARERIALRFE